MITKHFFKVLTIFTAMIAIGLLGIFIISSLDKEIVTAGNTDNTVQVAK